MTAHSVLHVVDLRAPLVAGIDRERAEFAALLGGAVALPFLLGFSQPLVGTVVNALLVLAALHVRSWARIAPLVVLPSIVAVGGGWVFSGATHHAIWLALPVIWAGNAALVVGLKALHLAGRRAFVPSLAFAAGAKVLILGVGLSLLTLAGAIPPAGLAAMVALQVVTAAAGGALGGALAVSCRRMIRG